MTQSIFMLWLYLTSLDEAGPLLRAEVPLKHDYLSDTLNMTEADDENDDNLIVSTETSEI